MRKWLEIGALIVSVIAVFGIVNLIHFQLFRVYVIFYSCLLDALIASLIVLPAYWFLRRTRAGVAATEFTLAALVANLALVLYSVVGPTVIDRSLSFYIVQKLANRGGHISQASLRDVFIKEYIPEYRLLDVRMQEQVSSGFVEIKDGCINLTPRGAMVASFMSTYRKLFLPKKRVLMGDVTDELNDPFSHHAPQVDVTCPAK